MQQRDYRRGAQGLAAAVGVGRRDQSTGLIPGQPDSGSVIRVHNRPGHPNGQDPAHQIVRGAVPVEAGQRREPPPHTGRLRALPELAGHPQIGVHPARGQHVHPTLVQPRQPRPQITGIGAPGPG